MVSDARYMSLRVLPTVSAGNLVNDPYWVTCLLISLDESCKCGKSSSVMALRDVFGHGRSRVARDVVAGGLGFDHLARGGRIRGELYDLAFRQVRG